jgi:hypothetical protein
METDFLYLLLKHGEEGARTIFETACEKTLKKEFPGQAFRVEPNPGDQGIDVFVGDFNKEIRVYQCKFFIQKIGDSQQKQITKSFKTAVESQIYKMHHWVLCLPITLDIGGNLWWSNWKSKRENNYGIKIELWDSGTLLGLMKDHKVDEDIFDLELQKQVREIHEYLIEKKKTIKQVLSPPDDIDFSNNVFIAKLKSAMINDHIPVFEKQFYNAEIFEKETLSKGIKSEEKELESLRGLVLELWLTQYLQYKHDNDGNELLGKVLQRIENEDSNNLRTTLNASLVDKKGLLHQLANDCKLGWINDYKIKLKQYYDKEMTNDRRE